MIKLNSNISKLKKNYLFVDIARKTQEYISKNPNADLIRMGIGDVTLPLSKVVVDAMKEASDEMSNSSTFKGYGPHEGYEFLREAISNRYKALGVDIKPNEIYVSDGAKSDAANILDIFADNSTVLISDPVYPVYQDSNVIHGNTVKYMQATEENGFLPLPDESLKADIICICSPNNPTGAVYSREQLKKWVDFALENKSIIIFDAAYEAFIDDPNLPHSIFEIDGAKKCAIELCSFSKSAGFTGIRCAYTVISNELEIDGVSIGSAWLRRQSIKFNGVSYVTQKAALASLSEEGIRQNLESIKYYKKNAKILAQAMDKLGFWYTGGKNAPYLWIKCPNNMKSWDMFDYLLEKCNIICTPGSGFGENGEGFIRLSSFGSYENTLRAVERLKNTKF